jgi:hypothetical protein
MNSADRRGLIARIRQVRSSYAASSAGPAVDADDRTAEPRTQTLEARIAHLEQMLQDHQDAVYEQAQRLERRLDEIEARLVPSALAVALSRDARERGL